MSLARRHQAMCLIGIGLVLGPASSANDCSPTTPEQLTALQEEAREALFEDEMDLVVEIDQIIQQQVACLTDVVSAEHWAAHLITMTIWSFHSDQAWEPLLRSALTAYPTVDRAVGPSHPLAWEAPAPPVAEHIHAVRDGVEVFVDGKPVTSLSVPVMGPHLIQVRKDAALYSQFITDTELPPEWGDVLMPQPELGEPQFAVRPFAIVGPSASFSTRSRDEVLSPERLSGLGIRAGIGVALLTRVPVDAHLEVGYHPIYGKNQFHLVYGWAAARLPVKSLVLLAGPTLGIGTARGPVSEMCASENRADICDDLDALQLPEAEHKDLLDGAVFRGRLVMTGFSAGVTAPLVHSSKGSGHLGLFAGVFRSPSRWYPWGQLGLVLSK